MTQTEYFNKNNQVANKINENRNNNNKATHNKKFHLTKQVE